MALVNKPDESIFASSAKQGEVDNFPDLLRGWGITFDQTQGIPPMEWFNFLFKRLDEKHAYLMQRGLPEWSATQDYTKGSCVQFDGVSYRALKNSKNNRPNESNSQYWVRWGFTLTEIARATLTQYGLTQLYTGYDSQREDLALTPKTAYQLKQLIDSNTRSLGNFIPNSKKSNAINSNSADTVATSAAVKTAYDKGVEAKNAADNAQQSAEAANTNANSRVAKSGDTMTGNLTVPNLIVNDQTNNNNFVQIGDDTKLIDVDIGHTVGLQATDNANDAYIAYGATQKRFGFDGNMFFADSALATNYIGHGSYAQQYNVAAPFYVHQTLSVARDTYHPFVKGRVRAAGQYGAAFSLGYVTNQQQGGDGYGAGIIHLISDAGNGVMWRFGHNGEFVSAGDVLTGTGRSLNSAIYREGNPHDIAFSWHRDGLKVRVDNVDIGRVAYKSDLTSKVDVGQIDAGNGYIRVQGSLLVISGGTAGGIEQSGSVYNAFPISFPNACVAVIPVHVGTEQTTNIIIENGSVTKYGFKAKASHRLNAAINYIAFGY